MPKQVYRRQQQDCWSAVLAYQRHHFRRIQAHIADVAGACPAWVAALPESAGVRLVFDCLLPDRDADAAAREPQGGLPTPQELFQAAGYGSTVGQRLRLARQMAGMMNKQAVTTYNDHVAKRRIVGQKPTSKSLLSGFEAGRDISEEALERWAMVYGVDEGWLRGGGNCRVGADFAERRPLFLLPYAQAMTTAVDWTRDHLEHFHAAGVAFGSAQPKHLIAVFLDLVWAGGSQVELRPLLPLWPFCLDTLMVVFGSRRRCQVALSYEMLVCLRQHRQAWPVCLDVDLIDALDVAQVDPQVAVDLGDYAWGRTVITNRDTRRFLTTLEAACIADSPSVATPPRRPRRGAARP